MVEPPSPKEPPSSSEALSAFVPLSSSEPLAGEIRRLPPPPFLLFVQALTLWLLLSAGARMFAALLLRHQHRFTLSATPDYLVLVRERFVFGRRISRTESSLPLTHLQEVTFQKQGESPAAAAGLAALFLGTFCGLWLITEGVTAGAGSLLLPGVLLVAVGVAVDALWGSGRTVKNPAAQAQLVIRVQGQVGWALTRLDPAQAERLVQDLNSFLSRKAASPPDASLPSSSP